VKIRLVAAAMADEQQSDKGKSGKDAGRSGRAQRLAAELRANLKKRKELARARERSRGPQDAADEDSDT
jgi:hypothetical protein